MDKRTILAIVLSMAVMLGFPMIQNRFFPPAATEAPVESPQTQERVVPQADAPYQPSASDVAPSISAEGTQEIIPLQTVVVETDLIQVELTNAGGNVRSYRLKQHLDKGEPVEMILRGDNEPEAFAVAFGNMDNVLSSRTLPDTRNFRVRRISPYEVEFSQDFALADGQFTMTKRYLFQPDEYMFELTIILDGGQSVSSFNFGGAGYTLFFAPQIGPSFEKLDQRYEFRHFLTFRGGKMRMERVTEKAPVLVTNQPSWAAIAGKYFILAALPYPRSYDIGFSVRAEDGLPNASRMFISRPNSSASIIEDKYHFYLGPKNLDSLHMYDKGDNAFRLRETGLGTAATTRGILAPLENGMKWLLAFFYRGIPNYGVAIIFLTILIKLVTFPLTKKSSEATLKMQALAPKIKEIQEKNKGNPQKMNAEMGEFYRKEGYNPLSGCLPMLIQLPILLAMFNMFNNHFDLRGAVFIPGWIPDLAAPEFIFTFPNDFTLPFLGWTALRLLPFIYVGSQLLYGMVVQTPGQQSNSQMKLMLYAMPVIFFFVLYNMPSGLLVYWIMSNVLTMLQQLGINKYLRRKKAATAVEPPKPIISGGTSKKRKRK